MSVALPDQLDPWRAVKSGSSFHGSFGLSELSRLSAAVVAEGDGEPATVEYSLSFERDAEGRACARGWIRSRLRLRCQRCLGEVSVPVDVPLALVLLASERGATDIPPDMDPWIVEDDRIRPMDLIEDELLLAIPVVPRHEPGDCRAPAETQVTTNSDVSSVMSTERENPFGILADLKGTNRGG